MSPHLDDAVFSCWSVLTREPRVVVINVFSGVPEPGFMNVWDRATGARDSHTRMLARLREDRAALGLAGCSSIELGLFPWLSRGERQPVAEALEPYLSAAEVVYAPAAVSLGSVHPDHRLLRRTVLSARPDAILYADQPYCGFRQDVELPPRIRGGRRPAAVELRADERRRKLEALGCYATQLPKLEELWGALSAERLAYELFWVSTATD